MTELYLILHKVRGEPAFDIAIQIDLEPVSSEKMWIIPTSGYRAYPIWTRELSQVMLFGIEATPNYLIRKYEVEADAIPDHYACNETPKPKPPSRMAPTTTDDFLV